MKKIKDYIKDQIKRWLRKHPSYVPMDIISIPFTVTQTNYNIRKLNVVCDISRDIYDGMTDEELKYIIIPDLARKLSTSDELLSSMRVEEVQSFHPNCKTFRATIYIARI